MGLLDAVRRELGTPSPQRDANLKLLRNGVGFVTLIVLFRKYGEAIAI
ncbi:hypothetical protein BU14_1733s0001 [Porphyra umbilicalis]|uniref:Uncharacterized protein n=1 Tax=Porphyra umbilicalis TaxID=2786 RepID=A0A1X6NKW1_PORUM|nr:hypothetical protein BU14_1733s0001 [Porphyra umbilicalis]|eukprot:OSX69212.1 hypothetical protein BU14_1733s0001 [Porphyra umbilicalis]